MFLSLNDRGYLTVRLSKSGTGKSMAVSRLVALTFIPNPEGKLCVNHINSVRNDNRLENLEWCTHGENMRHAARMGRLGKRPLKGEKVGTSKLTAKQVLAIRKAYPRMTLVQLGAKYSVSFSLISGIVRRKRWKHI
jgi:hypothetical protein